VFRTLKVMLEDGSVQTADCPGDLAIHQGDLCVLQNGRVLEYGRVQGLETHETQRASEGQPAALRRATLQDQTKAHENSLHARMALTACQHKAVALKLPLKILSVRYSFDRTVLSVTFTSEERVDYREFLKEISGELKTHIEMRQIGVRDASGRVGGMGTCGRRLCCSSWLKKFEAVGVKMAKQQRLALNPTTISGMCGRLKCCLRYEQDLYQKFSQSMPGDGDEVQIPEGRGFVVDRDIPRQRVRVRLDDNRCFDYPAAKVQVLRSRRHPVEKDSDKDETQ
jgi:cell fate regulator YaaT (PSP1 superfamily)